MNCKPQFELRELQCHLLWLDYTSFRATSPQVSFSDQTPYFIGWSLQSMPYPVEMMKWLWSTMKVTFGRWTAFIFITAQFLYYFPLIKHETHPQLGFSVTSVLASVPEEKYSRFLESIKQSLLNVSFVFWFFSLCLWHKGPCWHSKAFLGRLDWIPIVRHNKHLIITQVHCVHSEIQLQFDISA